MSSIQCTFEHNQVYLTKCGSHLFTVHLFSDHLADKVEGVLPWSDQPSQEN